MTTESTAADALAGTGLMAPEPDPDKDQSWFIPVTAGGNPPGPFEPPMSKEKTILYGATVLQQLSTDRPFRLKYYNMSRTWHKAFYASGGVAGGEGGEFGQQWIAFLADKFKEPDFPGLPRPTLLDFVHIHMYVFHQLRRSVLAFTGHDIDPESVKDGGRSFHYVPNDHSGNPQYTLGDLGLPPTFP